MKQLIFIGVAFLLGSCSIQKMYFSKRIKSDHQKEQNITKEQVPVFSIQRVEPVEDSIVFEYQYESSPAEKTDSLKKESSIPMFDKKQDPIKRNDCKCFGKSLIMSGSVLSAMAVVTFFSWGTLGVVGLVIGLLMITIGITIKKM